LADNDLAEIPARIGDLRHLRMLDLGHNAPIQLPKELGKLNGLRDFLYLHDSRLASLPTSVSHLKALRYLIISENSFQYLPDAVCGMESLIELRATDNQLANLKRLRELHFKEQSVHHLAGVDSRLAGTS
jgi:Leucine-rich repeat (LRR) protein